MNNNAEFVVIKCRINANLNEALRKVLAKLNITQQDFLEKQITELVVNNINLVLENDTKGSAVAK